MRRARILANVVGPMLFVQVILGGSSTILGLDITFHIIWGILTFALLIVTTGLAVKDFGRGSNTFKVGVAAIIDFALQGTLGLLVIILSSSVIVVVHLANAFILGTLATYFIVFADRADKDMAPKMGMPLQS